MGLLGFMERRKAKSLIRKHISSVYDLGFYDADVIMNSSPMANQIDMIGRYGSGGLVSLSLQIKIKMVAVAESYMEKLLNRKDLTSIVHDDKVKLKYCLGVMVNIFGDDWPAIETKLLRLDLWRDYWSFMDVEGQIFTKEKKGFIPTVFLMLKILADEGSLGFQSGFPFDEIEKEVLLAYDS